VPTYQYSCTECGHFFEQVQSFTEESLTVCPECQGRLRKVFNAVGVVFKGSGFYRTDSRSDGSAQGAQGAQGAKVAKESGAKETGTSGSSGSTPKSTSSSTPSSTSPGSSSGSASGSSATGASVG